MAPDSALTKTTLKQSLHSLHNASVIIVGDVMLDRYIFGDVDRISPEAPVPVVNTTNDRTHLGGAGNVALNINALGGVPYLVGVSGSDDEASLLEQTLHAQGIEATIIPDPSRPTTVKTRVIANNQQVVRIDRESTQSNRPDVTHRIIAALESQTLSESVIVVSDYGKGIVTPEFISGLSGLSARLASPLRVLIDPKPVNMALYNSPYLMTPNLKEAAASAGLHSVKGLEQVAAAGREIQQRIACRNLLVTLGANGMALFEEDSTIFHVPAMAQEVFDVTGAGDTVIAMMGLALASGQSLLVSSLLANYAAGIVVGEVGAATAAISDIDVVIDRWPLPKVSEINPAQV